MKVSRLTCDRIPYSLPQGLHTEANLRAFFGVDDEHDLWMESEGDDRIIRDSSEEVDLGFSAKFYTTSKKINDA